LNLHQHHGKDFILALYLNNTSEGESNILCTLEGKRQNGGEEWEQRKCKEKRVTAKRKAPSLRGKGKCGAHFVRKHRNLELKKRFFFAKK
jgi:hypothetical protein